MKLKLLTILFLLALNLESHTAIHAQVDPSLQVKVVNGLLQGTVDPRGIRAFKGIPYAEAPVGNLRWKEPQPLQNWDGVRMANQFGPRPMQIHSFPDQVFRSHGMSEDCLYLNVWTPAKSATDALPVFVYVFGGGFTTGDGSEERYDGASMARQGIVTVTINYRLGIFGFLANSELSAESTHHASGNYGLLDQVAALRWVHDNIKAFGGDPNRVTIGGESAGSISVSALMASPLSKKLFFQASGESGSMLETTTAPLATAERRSIEFEKLVGANSIADLRAIPADQLLNLADDKNAPHFRPIIDGYFLPQSVAQIFGDGKQAKVPLLAGWNSAEVNPDDVLQSKPPTLDNFDTAARRLYGDDAYDLESVYAHATPVDTAASAQDLASDRFIAFGTWKWIDSQSKTGEPVYRYLYAHPLPPAVTDPPVIQSGLAKTNIAQPPIGARHASEIAYALGNLDVYTYFAWTPDDYKVSAAMQTYFANFIKSGNPNSPELPVWNPTNSASPQFMRIDVTSQPNIAKHDDRYEFLDSLNQN